MPSVERESRRRLGVGGDFLADDLAVSNDFAFDGWSAVGVEHLGHTDIGSGERFIAAAFGIVEAVRAAEVVFGACAADGRKVGVTIEVEFDFSFAPPAGAL